MEPAFLFYIWNIWLARNERTFKGTQISNLNQTPYNKANEFIAMAGLKECRKNHVEKCSKWTPSIVGYKLNIDDSFLLGSNRGGIGGILRDSKGIWKMGYMGQRYGMDATQLELLALVQGLKIVVKHNLVPLEINIDCLTLISLIKLKDSKYENVIVDCRDLLRQLGNSPPPPL